MPTTDELQSQINALQSQLNSILGMADDDYIHQYSGEEIDAGITAAGSAVRYDLAQALTTAQQAQARGNIAAAPNGYGYGDNAHGFFANPDSDGSVATAFFDALLDQMGNGVTIRGSFVDYPYIVDTANGGEYELLRGNASSAIATITIFGGGGAGPYRLTWTKYNNAWRAPEWTNPPLALGVEYRTTERYLGKPVYCKLVNCGEIAGDKTVAHGISSMSRCIFAQGNYLGAILPMIVNRSLSDTRTVYISSVSNTAITIICGANITGGTCYVQVKYTKTTD
nr:MAG TPA: hypothetical protein [Caudoviricetes sp.]